MEEKIFKLAELLADEAFGKKGLIAYSERQELAVKFNEILVNNLDIPIVSVSCPDCNSIDTTIIESESQVVCEKCDKQFTA